MGTLHRLTALREGFLEPLIADHRGRVVKLMGDGMLVEFASVVDAVTCAVAWQDGVAEREVAADENKRLKFRIGINLGDVIVEGDDIHGDAVNIAARLEGLSLPGGICLSGDAYRHAKGKVGVDFRDLIELRSDRELFVKVEPLAAVLVRFDSAIPVEVDTQYRVRFPAVPFRSKLHLLVQVHDFEPLSPGPLWQPA